MTTTLPSIPLVVSGRRPDVPLDLADALDLLCAAVEQRGPAYVLRPVAGPGPDRPVQAYALNGKPRCIIGHALSSAGVPVTDLELMLNETVRDLYRDNRLPINITLGALIVLDAAQRSQARGRPWGDVLDDAVSAMAKFLDLVPVLSQVAQFGRDCRASCLKRQARSR